MSKNLFINTICKPCWQYGKKHFMNKICKTFWHHVKIMFFMNKICKTCRCVWMGHCMSDWLGYIGMEIENVITTKTHMQSLGIVWLASMCSTLYFYCNLEYIKYIFVCLLHYSNSSSNSVLLDSAENE